MFNYHNNTKIIPIILFWLIFWLFNLSTWYNLTDEISWFLQKHNNLNSSKLYQDTFYSPNLPKDPFWEAVKHIEQQSIQQKLSWTEYIEKVLSENHCSISQKKIWSILYYYVPEFKSDLATHLKKELGSTSSQQFIMDHDKVISYCYEYYSCITWVKTTSELLKISHDTPSDIETNCKEFFQENYKRWQANEQRKQSIQSAQMWFDKYRNSTIDDSPYDIMIDFWNVWKLLYQEVEDPITPISYKLPIFSKSANALKQNKEKDNVTPSDPSNPNDPNIPANQESPATPNNNIPDEGSSSDPTPLPKSDATLQHLEWLNDYLLDEIWTANIKNNWTYYGDICKDEDSKTEPSYINQFFNQKSWNEDLDLSDEEFKELIEYMQWSVDSYLELTEEQKKEIAKYTWNPNDYISSSSPSDLEATAKQIKNCFQSCNGLRFDQKASCMMMCACWEINSPIFDPNKTPWLWPILMIRFCTVPGINHKFSVWWRKIMSIEEWISEIYWVVDKLSREWRLWIRTQQYNFLDSTTKKTKIADTVAFTISVEFADIWDYKPKQSKQYKTLEAKKRNETLQTAYHISNDLENPVEKNRYRLISDGWDVGNDFSTITSSEANKSKKAQLSISSNTPINQNSDANASRYSETSESLHRRIDQQWTLWIQISNYINELDKEAKMLYSKKRI